MKFKQGVLRLFGQSVSLVTSVIHSIALHAFSRVCLSIGNELVFRKVSDHTLAFTIGGKSLSVLLLIERICFSKIRALSR